MSEALMSDYYELLQVSSNAEPETIHRVYRLLAPRFHPDNQETGDADRFRALRTAYETLSDPETRAQYDVACDQRRQERWRPASTDGRADNEFEMEQVVRLTVLEVLYTQRRASPNNPGIFVLDIESLTGQAREHLEFTTWYLSQKQLVQRGESSRIAITADGVDYLERHYRTYRNRRLMAAGDDARAAA